MGEFQVRILAEVIFFAMNFFTVFRMILINIDESKSFNRFKKDSVEFISRIKRELCFKVLLLVGAQCFGL